MSDGPRAYLSVQSGVDGLDAETGETLWEFDVRNLGFSIPGTVLVGERLLVRWAEILHGLRGIDGAELWRNEFPEWESSFRLVSDGDGGVYVSAENELARIDPATGAIRWQRDLAGKGELVLAAGSGVVCSRRVPIVTVACYAGSDGALLWEIAQLEIAAGAGSRIVGERLVVEVDGVWIGLDLETGVELWRRSEPMPPLGRSASRSGVLCACRDDCLALRASDGAILWRVTFEGASIPTPSADFVFVVALEEDGQTRRGRLYVLDPVSGNPVDGIDPEEGNGFGSILDYEGGRLFISTREDVRAYRYP
ncbi:MAG: PQQ-binding-like beta-propeller repeat protein [Gemmatimonadetes bacterium]|nr:PQQ-binding-like beta-propeller repeat protein [Gemmatimonadota bacterium]